MRNQLDKSDLKKLAVDSFKSSGPLYIYIYKCTKYYGRAQEAFKGPQTPHFSKPDFLGHPALHLKKLLGMYKCKFTIHEILKNGSKNYLCE